MVRKWCEFFYIVSVVMFVYDGICYDLRISVVGGYLGVIV